VSPSAPNVPSADMHTCGLATDGTAWCWGANNSGQLGDQTQSNATIPVAVRGAPAFRAISAGYQKTCALTAEGQPWCWQYAGRTGVAQPVAGQSPRIGGFVFADIRASATATCGLEPSGQAWCWGTNVEGQTGTGLDPVSFDHLDEPVRVSGNHRFVTLANTGWHACAAADDGSVWCWGANWDGQLGDGTRTARNVPVQASRAMAVSR
jgi:alpha-tubulin suppressor-like RCC1 family protein